MRGLQISRPALCPILLNTEHCYCHNLSNLSSLSQHSQLPSSAIPSSSSEREKRCWRPKVNNDPHHDHSHHHQAPLPTCFSSLQVRRGPVYHHSHDQNFHPPPHLRRVFSSQRGWRPIVDTPSPLSMVPAWESLQKEWCGRGGSYPPTCLWIPSLSLL